MARNFTAILALGLFACIRTAAASGMDAFAIATQVGLRYENAHAADDMRTVVADRVRVVTGGSCPDNRCSDVVLIDLRSSCGSDRMRFLTTDGRSRSCSIDQLATRAAWLTVEPTGTRIMLLDLTDPTAVPFQVGVIASGNVSSLNLGHDAEFLAALVDRGAGGVDIVRFSAAGAGPDVVATMPFAGQLTLNGHRAVGNDGLVAYSKLVGLKHDVFRRSVAGSEVNMTNTPDADERSPSVGSHTTWFAYVRTESTGVDNVWRQGQFDPVGGAVTENVNPDWRMYGPVIGYRGVQIAFTSNGNFVGANEDLSREAFIVGDGLLQQITEHSQLPPPSPPARQVLRAEILEQGKSAGLGVWASSSIADLNSSSIVGTTFVRTTTAAATPACETYTPFRAYFGPEFNPVTEAMGDCIVGIGCTRNGSAVECSFGLTNSADKSRSFQIWPTWTNPDVKIHRPQTVTLAPSESRLCTLSYLPGLSPGSVSIVVTSADGTRTDARSGSLPWP